MIYTVYVISAAKSYKKHKEKILKNICVPELGDSNRESQYIRKFQLYPNVYPYLGFHRKFPIPGNPRLIHFKIFFLDNYFFFGVS